MAIRRWLSIGVLAFLATGIPVSLSAFPAAAQQSVERSFKVGAAVELVVKTGSEDLEVRAGDAVTVRIECTIKPQNNYRDHGADSEDFERVSQFLETHLPVRQEGNRISIEPLEQGMLRHANIRYDVTVPADTRLTFETGSGDLIVEDIRGPVEFTSSSGDMKLRSVRESVHVHTDSGDVVMEDVGQGGVDVETQSGDVVAHLASQAGYDLKLHTDSGDYSVTPDLTLQAGDTKKEVRGKIRGGGKPVNIRTASGDIHVD